MAVTPLEDLPWPELPPESAQWSWEQWQRHAGAMLIRDIEYHMDQALFGTLAKPISIEEAGAVYDRAQAEARREATNALCAGSVALGLPDGITLEWEMHAPGPCDETSLSPAEMAAFERKLQRRILKAFRLKPKHIGLGVPPLAIDGHAYHQRQRNRAKRRRR